MSGLLKQAATLDIAAHIVSSARNCHLSFSRHHYTTLVIISLKLVDLSLALKPIGASLSEPHTSESLQRNSIFTNVHPTVSQILWTNLSVIDYGFLNQYILNTCFLKSSFIVLLLGSKHASKQDLSEIKCTSSASLTMLIANGCLLLFIFYSTLKALV